MKKILAAILLVTIFVLTFALTACNNVAVTKVFPRWEDEEEYVFGISLADFDEDKKGIFNTYGENNDYYRDMVISTAENAALLTSDEIRPNKLTGELVYKISKVDNSTNRKFVTVQKMYAQYSTEDLQNSANYSDLQNMIAEEDPFGDSGFTTLYSETTTEVVFKNEAINDIYIVPVSSKKVEDGFYIGKLYQGVSRYEISTEYNFEGRTAKVTTVKKDAKGENPVKVEKENKLGIAKGGYCIDSNMLLLYVRSLSKSANDFASNPSISVYNAQDNTVYTASFGIMREQKVVLNNGGSDFLTSLNVVGVTLSGKKAGVQITNQAFMIQENLSDKLATYKTDLVNGNSKYTTVRFRVGIRAYELKEHKTEWIDALSVSDEKANSVTITVTKAEEIALITNGAMHKNVNVTWALKEESEFVSIRDGKTLVVSSLPTEKKTITLIATFTSGTVTDTKEVSVTLPAA